MRRREPFFSTLKGLLKFYEDRLHKIVVIAGFLSVNCLYGASTVHTLQGIAEYCYARSSELFALKHEYFTWLSQFSLDSLVISYFSSKTFQL